MDRPPELAAILDSSVFEKSPTLRKLLIYLWAHREDDINEYAIATEALGRKSDFEPRSDATVRVLISRLRQRLKQFYETDGATLPHRIVIPVGSHQIQLLEMSPIEASEPGKIPVPSEQKDLQEIHALSKRLVERKRLLQFQTILICILLGACLWLLRERNHALELATQNSAKKLSAFWSGFLSNGHSTRIVAPTPVFFGWNRSLLVRDVNVNDFEKLPASPALTVLAQKFGKPVLSQQYVAASDAIASLRLAQFLDQKESHLSMSTTAESPIDTLDRENLILTGTPRTLAPFQSILDRLSFWVDAEMGEVADRRSGVNSPRRFKGAQQSSLRMTTPGIIASVPGSPNGTHVLILVTTYYTSALVSYLTSEAGLHEIQEAQKAHGNCPYFEAVVLSEINGTTELRSKLVEFRPYNSKL